MKKEMVVVDVGLDVDMFIPNYVMPNKFAGFKRLLNEPELTSSAKRVFVQLLEQVGTNLVCWPSVESLAESTGLDKRTVLRALKQLAQARLIINIRRGFGLTNMYGLIWHKEYELEVATVNKIKFYDLDPKVRQLSLKRIHKSYVKYVDKCDVTYGDGICNKKYSNVHLLK